MLAARSWRSFTPSVVDEKSVTKRFQALVSDGAGEKLTYAAI
jgi:hypothetical protein|tara:strand:+ start:1275 stop:1400 length:126 start_codon:yes stop_codon:yes gene_type:complete